MRTMLWLTSVTVLCSAAVLGAPELSLAACDQTLSVGANVAAAVTAAPNGSTICLNTGNYGTVNLFNIARSGFVTLTSASGRGAQMSPQVSTSKFIKFSSMTLTWMRVSACSTDVQILNSTFVPNTPHLFFNNESACSGVSSMNLLVDGNTFDKGQQATYEGRISVRGARGLTISNNVISGVPSTLASDGIQIIDGSRDITVGPGNRFTGILQSLCGDTHCDSIQDYGGGPNNRIVGNHFENADVFIMMPDGSSNYTVEHNVFDGTGIPYQYKLQFGSAASPLFRHNTLKDAGAAFDSKVGEVATTNALIENNLFTGNLSTIKTSGGSGCTSCVIRYNMFSSSSSARGTNVIIGLPAFVGGPAPETWAEWALVAGSLGTQAGNDGKDLGITVSSPGGSPVSAPAAPTGLVVQ